MTGVLTGTVRLWRTHLRAGWRGLVGWTVVMTALLLGTASSLKALYPTLAARETYAASAGASPAVAAFNGRGYDLTELGGIVGYEMGFMALLGFPVLAIHLAIRFSRHEEDAGRTELITAGRVGRLAPLAAAALTVVTCLGTFWVLGAVGLQAMGLPAAGSWLYTGSLTLYAVAFGALGLLAAEVSREARTAYGLGLVAVTVAFVVRAVIDGRRWDATWASPQGWLAEVRPWGAHQWWPLLAFAAMILLCGGLAVAMALHRDLAGGLVATRLGPSRGSARLGTPVGYAWRFARGALIGWIIGTCVWAVAFGSLSGEMTDIVAANPALLEALGVSRPEQLVTTLALLLGALGAACFGVQAMVRLAREESSGRLGFVLSTRTTQVRVWSVWVLVVALGAVVILQVSSVALAVTTALSTGDGASMGSVLSGAASLALPVVVIVVVAAAMQAVGPRIAALAWSLVGWGAVVGMLAETMRLPSWARNLSPLYAVGQVPVDSPDRVALGVMGVLVVVLAVGGLLRFGRRDLAAG